MIRALRAAYLGAAIAGCVFAPAGATVRQGAWYQLYPQTLGIAEAPKMARSGQSVTYHISATDKDSVYSEFTGQFTFIPDTLQLPVRSIVSMTDATVTGGPILDAEGNPTGDALWTVSGTAVGVTETQFFLDRFTITDGRPTGDLFKDDPVAVAQTVVVDPFLRLPISPPRRRSTPRRSGCSSRSPR